MFNYLDPKQYYFDSACQTLRPQAVIDAEQDYYHHFNACGGRVKYKWGEQVDEKVAATRQKLLDYAGKSSKDYCVVFTLNTTYGINLVLQQLPSENIDQILTSEIEHNSVFLPSMTWAEKNKVKRIVLPRDDEGNLIVGETSLKDSVVILNSRSNIDGRPLPNAKSIATEVHRGHGLLLLDGAQHFSHSGSDLKSIDFDALFGSGHKMYGPSIGFIIIKKTLIKRLQPFFLGGGTVTDVQKDDYQLIDNEEELFSRLEIGLQNWAGIIGLGASLDWLNQQPSQQKLEEQLFEGLGKFSKVSLINKKPSPIVSLYVEGLDAHRLALYLAEQNIMCRSGYFCCHYYLKNLKKYPPLLRVSLGLHNTPEEVDYLLKTLGLILQSL